MRADEFQRLALLFVHEGRLADPEVAKKLPFFGNPGRPHKLPRRIVVVVPDVEFKRKVRAQWNKPVKHGIIPHRPGHATQDGDPGSHSWAASAKLRSAPPSVSGPA